MNTEVLAIVVGAYALIVGYLGWLGYRRTSGAADYLVGGREIHPLLMAMAYGSTFISTAAIVGFGGMAAFFGLGLLWLVMLNIFFGIFIAFVLFGRRTRSIGVRLDAHTFPELLGRRFGSRFIQGFAGTTIAILMPIYAAGVMIGGARFLEVQLGLNYELAVFIFAMVVVSYVFFGGLKGVIYTDAFQGTVMFVGMVILMIATYNHLGWFQSHAALTDLAAQVPKDMVKQGHQGWTAMPASGSGFWYTLITTIILGVGIGVLAQPQLAVRFMTVKSGRELYRALIPGGIFILMIPGVAYMVGGLSNLYFWQTEGKLAIQMVTDPATGVPNMDKVMPTYILHAMPEWFGYLFMLTLLAAAMSTLSGQFHAIGTSIGRDLYQQALAKGRFQQHTVPIAKLGVFVGFVLTILLVFRLPVSIVAIATSLFFGMCAAVFLPAYVAALFWKRATRAGVTAGMLTGLFVWGFWVLFVHLKESSALGIAQALFGRPSLLEGTSWPVVDSFVVALPLSALVTWIVSLLTSPMPKDHVERCFGPEVESPPAPSAEPAAAK